MKFLLDELRDAITHSLRSPLAPAKDETVIRIAHKRVSALFQFLVQFLVQFVEYNVTQQLTQRAALRRPLWGRVVHSVYQHPGIQVFVDEAYHPTVLYRM